MQLIKPLSIENDGISSHTPMYKIHIWDKWNKRAAHFAARASGVNSTLFQGQTWLSTWYDSFTAKTDATALVIGVEDHLSGELLMLLPLCIRTENNLKIICFADFGLADYNAPILHPDFSSHQIDKNELLDQICAALPPADLLKLEKMPLSINGVANPLAGSRKIQISNLRHYGIEIKGNWQDYWSTLKRSFRKDQRRRWRVLEKQGKVSFVQSKDPSKITELFDTLTKQQQKRLHGLNLPYLLDDPQMKQFYKRLIKNGCADGPVIFTGLLVDDLPVATLCGLGDGTSYAMTISGYETGEWQKASPGRLLTERTMEMLHQEGYSYFDFTIGDEPYKQSFAIEQGALYELYLPLSWKAYPQYALTKAKALQRQSPAINRLKNYLVPKNTAY